MAHCNDGPDAGNGWYKIGSNNDIVFIILDPGFHVENRGLIASLRRLQFALRQSHDSYFVELY